MTVYYSNFYPLDSADGAKGSAAFLGAISTALVYLYKRSATALTGADKPNGDVVYTFSTGSTNISAVTNGWTLTIPSGTDPLYVVAATATSTEATDTIASNEWSSPVVLAQNGLAGTSVATVFLFKRGTASTPLPAVPTGSATYTFSSGILLGTSSTGNTVSPYLNGWSQTAPDSSGGKYLFVTTATAISTGATDTIEISEWATVRILAQDGAQGYTAYLTNESHTLPAASDGTVSSYTGATGSFKVYLDGVGDISSDFTINQTPVSNTQGLAFTFSGNTYTITGGFDAAEDIATITMRAVGGGLYNGVTIDKVFSLSKSKSGANGTPAKLISVTTDRQLISYDGAGALSPASQTTTFSVSKQGTTATVNWTIKDTAGNVLTPASYLSSDLAGTTGASTGDIIYLTAAKFQSAISVNGTQGIVVTATVTDGSTLVDQVTIMKVKAGTNGTNGTSPLIYDVVTSSPVIVKDAADAATTGTYSSITIQGKKYDGNATTNYGWVTVTANGDTEATTATDTASSPFTLSPASNSGKSSYTVKLYNQATVSGATLLDTQTITVVFKGAAGSNGSNARGVSLSVGTQAFAYDSSGANPSPASTTVTATAVNTTGTVYYEFLVDGTSAQNTTGNTYTYTPQSSFSNMPDTVRVNIREGGTGTTILASDSIAITGLKNTTNGVDGLNALTTVLSNSAHTLPTTNTGTVTYTGSGTTIRLYEGTTELVYDGTGTANGTWKVTTAGTNITPGGLTDSGNFVTVADHSGATANTASISYTITGKRANGAAISIAVVQTFSKSIQGDNGANGTSGLAVVLSNETHVFPASSTGAVSSYTGSGTLIRVYEGATELVYDGTGTANGTWAVSSTATNITRGSLTDSGNYVTVGEHSGVADGTDTSSIVYTITGKTSTGAAINITKNQTFSKSKSGANGVGTPGAPAVTAYATNEAQSLFAYADGTVVSFATANGLLKIYSGSTDVTADADNFSATASGCTGTINTATNTPVNGQPKGYYQITAMTADTATLTVSARYPAGTGTTYTKIYTITKTRGGYEIVSALPTSNLFDGRVVYLTTADGSNPAKKLYRYVTGTGWTAAVPAVDISGTIVGTQISDGAISTDKLAANAVTAGKIAANTITANEIAASAITADELAVGAVTAGKISVTSLSAITATIGTLRTSTTGGRTEISDNVIKVFDGTGTLRVKIGNLAL